MANPQMVATSMIHIFTFIWYTSSLYLIQWRMEFCVFSMSICTWCGAASISEPPYRGINLLSSTIWWADCETTVMALWWLTGSLLSHIVSCWFSRLMNLKEMISGSCCPPSWGTCWTWECWGQSLELRALFSCTVPEYWGVVVMSFWAIPEPSRLECTSMLFRILYGPAVILHSSGIFCDLFVKTAGKWRHCDMQQKIDFLINTGCEFSAVE